MKKYNIKIFKKIKLNAVGADVSVRLRKNQNRNNIRTFDKQKSDAVGETSLSDPQTKYKYINKPMSNEISKCYYTFLKIEKDNKTGRRGRRPLQVIKSNFGITLIALIITIIVLLILAGVTLNMVMGENGIFGKANNAKNKTEVAQYEEELRMCVLELQTEEASNGRTFNMDTIRDNLDTYTQKLEDETIEWKEKDIEEPTGIYKGYNFYIDKKYGAHITGKATGIQISMKILSEIPETGYTNQDVNLKITITNNEKGLKQVTKPDGNTENLNGAKTYEEEKTTTENTKYTYVVTDTEGKEETKEVEIKIIDKNAPKDFTITAENTEKGLKIEGTTTDIEETKKCACSGIDKYEYYVKKSTDNDYTKYDSNIITSLLNGIYDIKVIVYDKAGNLKEVEIKSFEVKKVIKRTNISAQDIKENPEGYYGKTVDYTSVNGQNDWKIFYSDGTNIYLITGNYVKVTDDNGNIDTKKINENTGIEKADETANYRVCWNNSKLPNFDKNIDSEVISKFKVNTDKFNFNECKQYNKNQYKYVFSLLYSEWWENYLDISKGNEQIAIGGATLPLLIDSWNSRYPKEKKSITSDNLGIYYSREEFGLHTNNGGELYFPNKCITNNFFKDNKEIYACWMSSPSENEKENIWTLTEISGYGPASGEYIYNHLEHGLRPIVCLNSNISLR